MGPHYTGRNFRNTNRRDYKPVPGPLMKPEEEKEPMDVKELALVTHVNTGLVVVGASRNKTRGVKTAS